MKYQTYIKVIGGAGMKKAHEIDFTVYGDDMQFVEIGLDSGESVVAERGP